MQTVAIKELQVEMGKFKDDVGNMGTDLPSRVRDAILASCEVNGAIPLTRDAVEEMIRCASAAIARSVDELSANLRNNANLPNNADANNGQQYDIPGGELRDGFRWWFWDGAFHMVPAGWRLPVCNSTILFSLWLDGNARERIQPYRFLRGADLRGQDAREAKKHRAYLAKAKKVMNVIVSECGFSAKDLQSKDSMQRNELFRHAFTRVTNRAYSNLTDKQKRTRRLGDLTYLRLYDAIRKGERNIQSGAADRSVESASEGDGDS